MFSFFLRRRKRTLAKTVLYDSFEHDFGRMMMTMAQKKIAIIKIQVPTVYLRHDQEIGRFFCSHLALLVTFWQNYVSLRGFLVSFLSLWTVFFHVKSFEYSTTIYCKWASSVLIYNFDENRWYNYGVSVDIFDGKWISGCNHAK